ncbi:MAG: phosphoribosylglycinamide formyltransferase [Coriobacteriales bacterium]
MRDLNTPLNIAVLISGTGSNMVAIAEAIQAGGLNAKISYVVASNPRAKGIAKAQEMGLDTMVFTPEDYAKSTAEVERAMVRAFRNAGVDYVIMAGYMRKCTGTLLLAYPNRVVNLHPALLPKHKGAHAIQDAFEAGDEVTGITIHLANMEYDEGPIIYQREVPVLEGDSLEDLETRIHAAEHEAYPWVIQKLAQDKVHLYGDHCVID